ncbi:hypothetical protein TNCV_2288741 [Trichonephila clavipes]|uniref:Brinker DNA-binding domain-containing protein n=1 Tax=Trichonephila clavipes TaxID=2585209 RepID=A0A8X6V7I5_TRICX|nr:hypothetical protein TNCV_2288741 [Trichonephila clavipes]
MRIFEAADYPPVWIIHWLFTVKAQLPGGGKVVDASARFLGALVASTWSTKIKRDSFTYRMVWQHRVSGVESHISFPLITKIARCTVFCFRILSFIFHNVDETSPEFFTAEFKLKVVEKAEKDENREAGHYFEVDEKAVRNWCKQKDV